MKKKLVRLPGKPNTQKIVQTLASVRFIVTLAVIIVVATCIGWKYHSSTNPDRIFWGMVDSNLTTSAYTRQTVQKNGAQGVDQVFQTQTNPRQVVYAETVFTQTGVDSAEAVTENIGTPTHDYVRYTSITTSQRDQNGKPLDFSKVLNKWAVTEPDDPNQTAGQIFSQSVLGVVPVSNLNLAQRRELMKTMKEQGAYTYTVTEKTRSWPFGRPSYTFNVLVKPVPYITVLKQFAGYVGLNHLDGIDPQEYKSAQPISFQITVDGWTHQITSQVQSSKSEKISGRNLKKALPETPKDAISVDELQTMLQAIR